MPDSVGWTFVLSHIVRAAMVARAPVQFDAQARSRYVDAEVAKARQFPWWPLGISVVGLALPMPGFWIAAGVAGWIAGIVLAGRRADARRTELNAETAQIERQAKEAAEHVANLLTRADHGDTAAYRELLKRWTDARPPNIKDAGFELTDERRSDGSRAIIITGSAVPRSSIPEGVPRAGRGGRRVVEKRKAADIDEDLSQLNAAAVASVLLALFSGSTRRRVIVRQSLRREDSAESIDWVSVDAHLNESALSNACSANASPVDWIRALGGDVGRCKAKRYTAANGLSYEALVTSAAPPAATYIPAPNPTPKPATSVAPPAPAPTGARDPFSITIGASITLGEASTSRASLIPSAPVGFVAGSAGSRPTIQNVGHGTFSEVARRFKDYAGEHSARFVAFEQYWATYAHMAPGQLKFYFKWRNAVRHGETPRTDLSYIFVHVYELLHLIGANGSDDAAEKLERVWRAYRPSYGKLDSYLPTWTVDLLISEGRHASAMALIERALRDGASVGNQEQLVFADRFWERGDYQSMPHAGLALLAGDPRLGENKFYIAHNAGGEGGGWIGRAYRDALLVTDRVVTATHGRAPRELEIAQNGYEELTRESFMSAVYDYRRKKVSIGKVPRLLPDSQAIVLYRNAVRYAENFLRREKAFAAKLRGVEVPPTLSAALDKHLAEYVRKTKPRMRVVIDLERAADLARESADVRARLLEGLETPEPLPPEASPQNVTAPAEPRYIETRIEVRQNAPAGLLTDLDAIRNAILGLSVPARLVLEAVVACDWETVPNDPRLLQAAGGVLVGPLLDEINARTDDAVGDVLIVHEGDNIVVQEDFRDEVFCILRGSLDGFDDSTSIAQHSKRFTQAATIPELRQADPLDSDGFGPVELDVLSILLKATARGASPAFADQFLAEVARENATTPSLLVDRVNEAALLSPHGDLLIEQDGAALRFFEDAVSYVCELLARTAVTTSTADQ